MKNKNYLKNNGIALSVHILLALIFYLLNKLSGLQFTSEWVGLLIVFGVMTCIYFICGFFVLKPVDKYRFLSVVSVLIATVVGFICFIVFFDGSYEFLAYMNPLGSCIIGLVTKLTGGGVGVMILIPVSLVLPPVFLYLGMVLRKFSSKGRTD